MSRINLRNCVIKIKDGGSNSLTVKVGEGNVTWTEKKNREYYLDRGHIDSVRDGDDVPVDVKLDFSWEFLKSDSAPPTVEEALKKSGNASAWVSSDSDLCNPYAVDIEVTYTPQCASEKSEVYLFSDFRYEQLDHDIKSATVSITGKANVTQPSVSRVTHS